MTDQTGIGRPTTCHAASAACSCSGDARARYDELTQREQLARAYATLNARGGYDPAKHGSGDTELLTLAERLEIIAPARSWPGPTGTLWTWTAPWPLVRPGLRWRPREAAPRRRPARNTGSGSRASTTSGGEYGAGGRFGVDDAEYAAAIARADGPDPGAAKAYAATHRVLCALAGDGLDAHWLAPGGQYTRG